MGSASPSLAEALASQATDLSLHNNINRTASRLRKTFMRVPDRCQSSPARSSIAKWCTAEHTGRLSVQQLRVVLPRAAGHISLPAWTGQVRSSRRNEHSSTKPQGYIKLIAARKCVLCCRVFEACVPARQPPLRTNTVPFVFPPAGRAITERTTSNAAMRLNPDTIAGGIPLRPMPFLKPDMGIGLVTSTC